MAFLTFHAAASLYPAYSARRRSALPTAVRATANSNSASPHPILSSLRLAASAAVLLAATSPALACTPSPPPPTPTPTPLTATVSPDDPVPEDDSHPFEELIAETAALVRFGGTELARARLLSAAPGVRDSYARLLAAQMLFVDGKVEEAIAAFEELAQEDLADYSPLFCQGMLYFALGRTEESVSAPVRCREVAGDKFDSKALSPANVAVAEAESVAEKAEESVAEKAEEAEV